MESEFSSLPSTTPTSTSPLRITIFGAGAVGGVLACRLGYAAHHNLINAQVSIVVRGKHYQTIKEKNNTMVLRVPASPVPTTTTTTSSSSTLTNTVTSPLSTEYTVPFYKVTDNSTELGVQDIIIICIKAYSWSNSIQDICSLINDQTIILSIQNGIPWYLYPHLSCINSTHYEQYINRSQIISSVVYLASSVPSPGIIEQHTPHPKIIFGDIIVNQDSIKYSSNMEKIIYILTQANLSISSVQSITPSTVTHNINPNTIIPYPLQIEPTLHIADHIWTKLWGNLAFNLISVLTLSTMGEMINNSDIYTLAYQIMEETQQVGLAIQPIPIKFPQTIPERLKVSAGIPSNFKTSMYQDLENHRPLEITSIGETIIELAKEYHIPIPRIETIVQLVKLRNTHIHYETK